ncbi:MAG: CpsD/CapB family tyrosine-protein kinase [Acidobacteriia bacterium]|nr:CpsD/CapB family tyrosine-protein kinase [Terriglobia bacterium]
MSKLFEILNKSEPEIAQMIRPLLDGQPQPATHDSAAAEVIATSLEVSDPPSNRSRPAAESAHAESFLAQVRTLGLHVPAPSPLLPFDDGQWQASEQYRVLRTRIVQHPKRPRLIVISSAAPGDGKSISAINIAATLSLKSEARVLLVDADFRKSAIHVQLGLPEAPGLTDVLSGTCSPEEALVNARELPNLYLMCAGTPPANPVELLDSSPWPALCAQMRSLFHYVVVDSPPVAAVADYDLIQAPCDGVVLVVRPDHTPRQLLRRSLEIVAKEKLLGVVLNCVPEWFLATSTSPNYYYYSKGNGPRKVDPLARHAR